MGRDIFANSVNILSSAQNRARYEADIGLGNKMLRSNKPGRHLLLF